jgi:hypothetical protein
VGIAIGQAQRSLAQAVIALPQLAAMPGGKLHQDLAAAMVETRVGRERDCLRLHRVSIVTRSRLEGFTAPAASAASMVAASSCSIPLAPMRSRQRVSELGSIGN